jgi:hypothetical protein
LDQLYSRTEMPDGSDARNELPDQGSGAGAGLGIMSALPRRRPHRRSPMRKLARPAANRMSGGAVPAQAVAVAAEPAEAHPHLKPVPGGSSAALDSHRPRRSKRRTLPPPREPAPGIGRLALDGMVQTAKLPWRVAAEVARQAAGSVAGTLRR